MSLLSRAPTPIAAVSVRPTGLLGGPARRLGGLALAAAVLGLVALASLAFGAKPIPLGTVVAALTAPDTGLPDHVVVTELRVPRTVVGLAVGMALGLSGAVMQGLTRNPLADPGLLGVSGGASLAVVLAVFLLGVRSPAGYVWFAFAGAAVASVVVYALGSLGPGGASPVKLALAGAALSALLASLTSAVLLLDVSTLDAYRFWAVGSISGQELDVVGALAPFLVGGAILALLRGRSLNSLALGDDAARALGVRLGRARALAAVAVVLLVGSATAAAGPVAFVGLVVPHVARAVVGPDYRWILAWSLVLAPVLLLAADVLGRVVARPGEIQVGIVTALLGAPFFIALVRRRTLSQV
ncbi:MAG: FecCD family ABC transporter permease [Phycicoccus sp.]